MIDLEVEYSLIILSCYFFRLGFEAFEATVLVLMAALVAELMVVLKSFSLTYEWVFSFSFKSGVYVLNEVPGRLCFIGILTILGFCCVL